MTRAAQRASYCLARNQFFSFQLSDLLVKSERCAQWRQSKSHIPMSNARCTKKNVLALALSPPPQRVAAELDQTRLHQGNGDDCDHNRRDRPQSSDVDACVLRERERATSRADEQRAD